MSGGTGDGARALPRNRCRGGHDGGIMFAPARRVCIPYLPSDPYCLNAMHCAEQIPAIALPIEVDLTNR